MEKAIEVMNNEFEKVNLRLDGVAHRFELVSLEKRVEFLEKYIFDKDKIFAYLNLKGDEIKLYESIFPLLQRDLRKPDLVVFLQSSVDRLMHNIKSRARKIERNLTKSYITELSEAYNNFFFKYNTTPLLIVNTTDIDFVNRQKDFDELYTQIFREDRGFIEYFNPVARY